MAITSDVLRGHLESVILTLIMEKDRYAYEIAREIRERTDGDFSMKEATLYAMVQRLEKKDLIRSYIGTKSHGRKRRYYTLTPLGKAYFNEKVQEWKELKDLMSVFLEAHDETD
ncbi:MAG: PadR family transcriptional regulator [Bacillota bacterium]